MGQIIKSHSKMLTNAEKKPKKDSNCRKKEECRFKGKSRSENI